ncbi:MAG: hypothetical protein ACP5HM_14075 [Anaerolineae bacterium]
MLTTLLLSAGGVPRYELRAFLRAVPGLRLVSGAEAGATPDLLILDASTTERDVCAWLSRSRRQYPAARCLALVSSPQQLAEAQMAGAEQVLLAGFSAAEFFQTLDKLLSKESPRGPHQQ